MKPGDFVKFYGNSSVIVKLIEINETKGTIQSLHSDKRVICTLKFLMPATPEQIAKAISKKIRNQRKKI